MGTDKPDNGRNIYRPSTLKDVNAMPKNRTFPAKEPIEIRNALLEDIPGIIELSARVYEPAGITGYTEAVLLGQQNHFPEGQFVVLCKGRVIGYCGTFVISGDIALAPHTWAEITGNGFAARHDPDGDYLYGMEVFVDPDYRGYRIGQRLYNERRKLCIDWRLKGIVFGGRIPGFGRREKKFENVNDYIRQVQEKKVRDPVLSFQLSNGFEVIGILPNYIPMDRESRGHAAHLVWKNAAATPDKVEGRTHRYGGRLPDSIRVATVQYKQRSVKSFEEFLSIVEYFVDVVADYRADFVCFPEMFSLQLLSMEEEELSPQASLEALTRYTPRLKEAFREMAIRYNVNFIGGSHPTMLDNGRVENICYVFLRDGSVHEQTKIHPTPNEVYWWNIEGGSELHVIDTDCGPIGVNICYDSEFPELGRYLADQGANILFVPFCTDERQSYLRVRYCCQARAVENQCYVVMSGNVGNLPRVHNMDIQYAQSCILTPCDFPFSRDGIAADTTPNVETVAFADLRLDSLRLARNNGTVQNLKDRRFDLYRVSWKKPRRRRA